MPRKPKAQPAALPAIPAELLEQFGNGPMTAEAINAATLALVTRQFSVHLDRPGNFPYNGVRR
ncbi:TPA: hypothetical protein ACT5CR_004635 [Burkholderia cenocepacia]|uniref:Transposase n=1 Tax=Burkholderia cenocepacia TaxID=95486 RepID=A0ABD4UPZ0_9BURK|nr:MULTISPECIES: hypothetical protein [Burkholderia]AQQ25386.1 hypothetical protein A8E88_06695 [Burkholderia cenocepacia]MCA8006186.1 hypothetical protein [Burkholderia cenocepacia]MCW3698577.1 hypothetical protein [Burkholderia cenocepacia]MCW3708141.1 hypothetical protein [Burkholderia cenocepacia]MCW3716213.1 hypothetical protein [Burkholderia cenocepacia]